MSTKSAEIEHLPSPIKSDSKPELKQQDSEKSGGPIKYKPCPEEKANILSFIFFWWLNPLMALGNKKILEEEDLYAVRTDFDANYAKKLLDIEWAKELERAKQPGQQPASMETALKKIYARKFWLCGLCKLIGDLSIFGNPLVLEQLLTFIVESRFLPVKPDPWKGFLFAALLFVIPFISTVCFNVAQRISNGIGVQVKTSLISAMFEKSLKLTPAARLTMDTGKIVNMMSSDTNKLEIALSWFHNSWTCFFQIAVAIGLLVRALGPSAWVGIGIILILLPLQGFVLLKSMMLRVGQLVFSDKRLKMTNEMLQGVRVLKYYNWEVAFAKHVGKLRLGEMAIVKKAAYLRAVNSFLLQLGPIFMSVLSFIVLASTEGGDKVTAARIFSSLVLFNLLRFPIIVMPMMIGMAADAKIAMKRLDKFFLAEELEDTSKLLTDPNYSIKIENADFSWEVKVDPNKDKEEKKENKPDSKEKSKEEKVEKAKKKSKTSEPVVEEKKEPVPPVLTEVSLNIKKGSLTAIVGSVGCGKSSLLAGILGEMKKLQGEVYISGSIGFCPQQCWIQNCTVKDNILFGLPYDKAKYENAIKVCSLEHDIQILPNGDQTEIGERGINLSGGQKQRLSLARAVYFNADIILLDDVLSAVDSHVGKHIFEQCILNTLKSKTRLLVTHQLQYLSQCDHIVFIKDGKISEQGKFEDLIGAHSGFAKLMNEFGGQQHHSNHEEKESKTDGKKKSEDTKSDGVKKKKQELMQTEDRARGNLGWSVYKYYMVALGGSLMVILCVTSMALQSVAQIITNVWLGWWSDRRYNEDVTWYMGIYAGLSMASAIFTLFALLFATSSTVSAARILHDQSFESLLMAPVAFFDTTPIGRIMNRFSKDQDTIDNLLAEALRQFVAMLFGAIAVFIMMCVVEPEFTGALVPCLCIYMYFQNRYRHSDRELKRLDAVSKSPLFAHFSEALTGLSTIRAYKQQSVFMNVNADRLNRHNRAHFLISVDERWLGLRLETVGALIVFFAALVVVTQRETIDPGLAGVSLSYALQVTASFFWLVRQSVEQENSMNAVERSKYYTTEILHEDLTVVESKNKSTTDSTKQEELIKSWPSRGEIHFNDLEIRYRPGLPLVLKKVSLHILGGERIGVVGRTGSGKSTLMLALFRIMDAAGGSVLIDGIDISTLTLNKLRSSLAMIPQDSVLFSGTVRFNLDPFDQYSDEQIWSALEKSHLKNAIAKLESKLEAPVTENGENFSVGQRGLMCLARAMLRNSKILIMDEATANVDMETDSWIQTSLRENFTHCTILTIAHRLNTIIDYDRVIVMDNGIVSEFDTPGNLLRNPNSLLTALVNETGEQNKKLLVDLANKGQSRYTQEASARSQVQFHLDDEDLFASHHTA